MTRLLAAERQTALQHLLHDVLVADRASHEIDVRRAQRELETDVAHHGGDDGVVLEPALALQLTGVVPIGNVLPLGGLQMTDGVVQPPETPVL